MKLRTHTVVGIAVLTLGLAGTAAAQTTIVGGFETRPADASDLVAGTWYDWFRTGTATAGTVNLTGLGGDLETNQPLPTGAALLTTGFVNADRANVGLFNVLPAPADVIPSLEFDYSYVKASNPGQNLNAAAALKLEVFNPTCDDPASAGDCYGVLVFEPYVNGYGNFPPQDVWTHVSITPDVGGFWWTGGFGQPNSFAGPPYRTLNDWLGLMSSDFDDATIVTVQVGVGSFNQGQIAYFDDVRIRHGHGAGMDVQYDFQATLNVDIDLRPGNDQNQINTNAKQLVPVAILGTETFDPVVDVDPESVRLRGTAPIATKLDDDDVNDDGFRDLTVYFRARSFEEKPSEEECGDPDAKITLTGVTAFSEPFVGVDSVSWQGPDCNF